MLNTKKMLQDGFYKITVAVIVDRDRNGKEHLTIVDTLEHAKEYKCSGDQVKLATMFVKEEQI